MTQDLFLWALWPPKCKLFSPSVLRSLYTFYRLQKSFASFEAFQQGPKKKKQALQAATAVEVCLDIHSATC